MTALPKIKSESFLNTSFFIFIIRFFPSLASLAVVIYYSRTLPNIDASAYGAYQQFWTFLNVLYPLMCFGLQGLIINYSPGLLLRLFASIRNYQILSYAGWLIAIGSVFAYLFSSKQGGMLLIPFLFIVVYSLTLILEAFLIVSRYFKGLTLCNILYAASYVFVHIYILKSGYSLQQVLFYLLLITAARFVAYLFLVVSATRKNRLQVDSKNIDIRSVRSLWFHLGIYDVLQNNSTWVDKFVMSLLLSAQVSGIYFNGSYNIPFLPLLLSASLSAVLLKLATVRKEAETGQILQLMNQSGRVLSCIVFPLFFFLLFYAGDLFHVLFAGKFDSAVPIFIASILVMPLRAYSFTTVLQKKHKGSIINVGALMEIVLGVLLMYPLYQLMGLPGVAFSFVITTYLQAVFYLLNTARILQVPFTSLLPLGNWAIKLIVFSCIFIMIRYLAGTYFKGHIPLILGGSVAMIIGIVSLITEIKILNKNVSPAE